MLCGVLLIAEGAVNLGCVVYAAMELRALDRMADAAMTATLGALGDALDAEEEAEQAAGGGGWGAPPPPRGGGGGRRRARGAAPPPGGGGRLCRRRPRRSRL